MDVHRPLSLLFICLLAMTANGATRTFTRGTGSPYGYMADPANWQDGLLPAEGDDVVFASGAGGYISNNLPEGMVFRSMRFADDYSIDGNAFGLFDGFDVARGFTHVYCPVTLYEPQTWIRDGTGLLAHDVDLNGNELTLPGWMSLGPRVTGSGAIIVNGTTGITFNSTFHGDLTARGSLYLTDADIDGDIYLEADSLRLGFNTRFRNLYATNGEITIPDASNAYCESVIATPDVVWVLGLHTEDERGALVASGPIELGSSQLHAFMYYPYVPEKHEYLLIDNRGSGPIIGTFAGLPEGSIIEVGALPDSSILLRLTYVGGDGNDVVLQSPSAITTAVSVAPSPSAEGAPVAITATVSETSATGMVSFLSDAALLGTAPLNQGTAVLSTSAIPAGTHTITAQYPGDGHFDASSGTVSHTVLAATTTTLTIDPDVIVFNTPMLLTAQVASNHGIASGTVTFYDGSDIYATVPVDASGTATTTITFRDAPHTLKAVYSGSSTHAGSTSASITVSNTPRKRRAVR